jgi:hypothetical protein
MKKSAIVILNQLNIKNNKINKYNLKKIIIKKIIWGEHCSNYSVLKKKTTKLNFQPAQYEKK